MKLKYTMNCNPKKLQSITPFSFVGTIVNRLNDFAFVATLIYILEKLGCSIFRPLYHEFFHYTFLWAVLSVLADRSPRDFHYTVLWLVLSVFADKPPRDSNIQFCGQFLVLTDKPLRESLDTQSNHAFCQLTLQMSQYTLYFPLQISSGNCRFDASGINFNVHSSFNGQCIFQPKLVGCVFQQ